ncbi:DNA polymerase III subunit gamma/tau [uncultured Peptoniphilus sp.]|uniref:DNA polymerase III subunit gamma/tau n=1 Tax=uncultured Peptoniphilus sp. TaxID=254354 RepID=UPI00258E8345|nr:DNA polymerase III subunit gamma/tau [uncultured Peptoniphilus sp.]MDU6783267.1 DNA polymerase III subunit gamma/tau [Peptoniphilus harei]
MYKALYRKYRPKTFDEICGQEAVVTSLKNQVKNNEISHAYIFQGTRGTGKTSAAKILSRAVNCLHPVDGNPCNECENCKSILNESSLDVVEMDAASNNGVDDIRELKEKVIYPPQSLKYKVYIIDEVHMLSKGAFNALLKILEEPPRHLIFILATTEIEKIPATILSRSQKYNFKRISIEKISENLKKITELEGKSCDDEVFTLIAKSSDGAMRDALSVLDQLLTKNKDHIKLEDVMEVLGISSSELLFNLSRALIEKNVNESLLAIDEIYKEGVDFNTLSSQILNHFRDLLMVKTLKDPRKIVYSTFLKEFQDIAGRVDLEDLLIIIDILKNLSIEIKYAENKRVVFEMNAVKICNRILKDDLLLRVKALEDKINSSSDINYFKNKLSQGQREDYYKNLKDSKNLENKTNNIDNSKVKPAQINKESINDASIEKSNQSAIIEDNGEVKDKTETSLSLEKIKMDWQKIVDELISQNSSGFGGFLKFAEVENFHDGILDIVFQDKYEFYFDYCSNPERKNILPDLLKSIYDKDIDVRMKIKKSGVDKLEEIFGKNNIEDI